MMVFTIRELKTTVKTALNARQKWHLFLLMSLKECFHKKLQAEQQLFDLSLSVSIVTVLDSILLNKFSSASVKLQLTEL
jgi:hypothetical protein